MTNAAQRVKALIQDMTEDRKRYHALTTLLEKQRHHIVARDAASLDVINEQIMALYQQLSQQPAALPDSRPVRIDPSTEGLKTLIARLPAAHQPSVSALWQSLQQQAADCRIANDYNGALMSMQQDILGNLLNTSEPENWLYQQG